MMWRGRRGKSEKKCGEERESVEKAVSPWSGACPFFFCLLLLLLPSSSVFTRGSRGVESQGGSRKGSGVTPGSGRKGKDEMLKVEEG